VKKPLITVKTETGISIEVFVSLFDWPDASIDVWFDQKKLYILTADDAEELIVALRRAVQHTRTSANFPEP
jgi:hypothetical protein